MKRLLCHTVALVCAVSPAGAAVTVSDPSPAWSLMLGNYDFTGDQQTGQASGDIVGVGTNYGFFVTYNDNGPASSTDGSIGFRIRLDAAGGSSSKPAFDRVAWIGIDADINGTIDTYLGLNLQGSSSEIIIAAPGTGKNNSPGASTVSNTYYKSYSLNTANYNHRPVNYLVDGGTTNDVTPDTTGDPDYYVSFMVPFADVVAFLSTKSIAIDDKSPLRYVVATSTNTNNINQDIGGVKGGVNSTATWTDLGGFTNTVNASGLPVPEPSAGLLAFISLIGILIIFRRR